MKNQKNVVNNIEVVGESKQFKVANSSNLWKGANEHDDHEDTVMFSIPGQSPNNPGLMVKIQSAMFQG